MVSALLGEILRALLSVFAIVGLGAAVRRAGWLDDAAETGLVGLLVRVLMPALVLSALLAHPPGGHDLWVSPLTGALVTLLGFGLAALVAHLPARWTGLDGSVERRTFTLGAGLGNYAYLAIPVATALFGAAVLPTLLLFNVGVDLMLWTVGLQILPVHDGRQGVLRRVLNPPFLALVVGLVLGVGGLGPQVPGPLLDAITRLGQAAVPLGLIAVGAALGGDLGRTRLAPIAAASVVRFALLPVAALALVQLIPLDPALRQVVLVQSAMPSAVAPAMLARLYGGAPALASRLTLGTSLVGLVVVPLVLAALSTAG